MGLRKSIDLRNPFILARTKTEGAFHGLKFSRYHRRWWQEFTARHAERLFRPVPPGAVSFLGSSRCARCCPELELANGRRVTSHRGSAAVRIDDVPVCEAPAARVS